MGRDGATVAREKDLRARVEARATVDRIDPDTIVIPGQRACLETARTPDGWVAAVCGLDVRLY